MSNYLTSSSAIATYQTITNCSNYLTSASLSYYLAQIWQSIDNITTDGLNQWVHVMRNEQNTTITSTTHLAFLLGLNEFYIITTSQDITIYLPVIADVSQLGVRLIFRLWPIFSKYYYIYVRKSGSNSTNSI